MYRLAYVSTAHKAVRSSDLQDILEIAILNNGKDNITGTLLYNGVNFLQVLEGVKEDVMNAYERICADPRHHHIVTIFEESGTRRSFENAPMSLQTVPSKVGKLPNGIAMSNDIELFLPNSVPDYLRSMLTSFNTQKA